MKLTALITLIVLSASLFAQGNGDVITSDQAAANTAKITTTDYGRSCGPMMSITDTGGKARFSLKNAIPGSVGIMFLGVQKLYLPIPGSACFVHTNPLVIFQPAVIGASGELSVDLPLQGLGNISFKAQAVTVDMQTSEVQTTNGVDAKVSK